MSTSPLALSISFAILIGSASAIAQQGPRIDVLTGEPIRPRSGHPRPEPEIFNAPHAPRQEQRRADDLPLEIYVAPQMGGGSQQNQLSPGQARQQRRPTGYESYPTRRFPPDRGLPDAQDRAFRP